MPGPEIEMPGPGIEVADMPGPGREVADVAINTELKVCSNV